MGTWYEARRQLEGVNVGHSGTEVRTQEGNVGEHCSLGLGLKGVLITAGQPETMTYQNMPKREEMLRGRRRYKSENNEC